MRALMLITICLSFGSLVKVVFADSLDRYELGIALSTAANNRDSELLLRLSQKSLESNTKMSANDFGLLMVSSSLSWERLAVLESSAISNAYYFRQLAREILTTTSLDVVARQFQRVEWRADLYSRDVDERSFQRARKEEADLQLSLWRKIEDNLSANIDRGRPEQTASPLDFTPEGRARYLAQTEAMNRWIDLKREEPYFARTTMAALVNSYRVDPVDFDELRGFVEHHMNGSRVTNAWEQIVAAVPPKYRQLAAAAYPKPPVFTARQSLLPPVTATPYTPAISRPSKLRENLAAQSAAGMIATGTGPAAPEVSSGPSAGGDHSGGRSVWPRAVLGVGVLFGGWAWVRSRG